MDKEFFVSQLEGMTGMLYRVARTMLPTDDDCRDALQETALRAWEKRFTLREKGYFRTWVTRILINVCRDMLRRRRPVAALEDVPEPSCPPPDAALSLALAALPEKLRLPLVLFASEGMDYREISQALSLPLPTVRGRIHRARLQLRKELDER